MADQEPVYAKFGEDLRDARKRANLTVGELALIAGCSDRNVRNLESGKQRPNPTTVRSLADALGVTVENLTRSLTRPGLDDMFSEAELKRLAQLLAPLIAAELDRLR